MTVFWLRCAVALYAVGLIDVIFTVMGRSSPVRRFTEGVFAAGALLHLVAIVEQSVLTGHLAANNFFETASLCGLFIAIVCLVVEYRYKFGSLRLFLFPLVFVLTLAGSMGTPVSSWGDARVRNAWLLTHIVLVLIGYASLLISAGAAIFYLVQERRLKRKDRSNRFNLPPLHTLDSLVTRSMSIGFVAITLAVVAGSSWAFIESGTKWISEAKIAVSFATWGFYLLMVVLRLSAGWRGRKAALATLTVLGFGALTWAAHVGLRPLLSR